MAAFARRFPDIAAAEVLNSDASILAKLKLCVLGDCPLAEIAERLRLAAEVVEVWELLFFDVRANRNAVSWINHHIIHPEAKSGNPLLAAQMRLAYTGGPSAVRAILDTDSDRLMPAGERHYQRRLELQAKIDRVLEDPIDSPVDRRQFLKAVAKLLSEEGRLQLETKRLEEKCRQAERKHELAKLRTEVIREPRRAAEPLPKGSGQGLAKQRLSDATLLIAETDPSGPDLFRRVINDAA